MKQAEKQNIVELLANYCKSKGSQNKAAASLKNVSSSVISHLLNGNWEPYSDEMFRKIGMQLGYKTNSWAFVPTTNAKFLIPTVEKGRLHGSVFTIIGDAGSGKSEGTKKYASECATAIRVECRTYWDEKLFLQEILRQMGVRNPSNKVHEMIEEIIRGLNAHSAPPVLLLDEIDKLGDKLLYFLIIFYNELRWSCSIVLLATSYFERRLKDGARNRKKGYEELLSRYGTFVELERNTAADVKMLCTAQGVKDASAINSIAKSSNCDLRRASDLIRIYKSENHV